MVGGVSQGSEKKKVSVGLFSTFRHPLVRAMLKEKGLVFNFFCKYLLL